MNLQKVYFGFRANDLEVKSLLLQSDWFCRIAIFDPKTGEATRTGRKVNSDGKLQRFSKATGEFI